MHLYIKLGQLKAGPMRWLIGAGQPEEEVDVVVETMETTNRIWELGVCLEDDCSPGWATSARGLFEATSGPL